VIETHHPDQSPQRIGERLQAEIKRQQEWEILPTISPAVHNANQQAQISHIDLILDDATQKVQPRYQLPGKMARWPVISHAKVQLGLLKVYNFLFKEQRTAQFSMIQAVRGVSRLTQQILEQTQALQTFQQSLQKNASTRFDAIEQRFSAIEQRLAVAERQLGQIQLPETGIVELDQICGRLTSVEMALQTLQEQHDQRLRHLQSGLSEQRRLVQQLPAAATAAAAASGTPAVSPLASGAVPLDDLYSTFEEEFRGSQTIVRDRLKIYLPLLADIPSLATATILDLGCGRGEWLDLLRESGYQAMGVDCNIAMLEHCQERQLNVVHGDALSYLRSLPDASVGGVSGFHIVEHLPFEQLVSLLAEAFRVVQPGGFVLFETPNPQNVLVGSFSFYLDPTHRNPLPMEVMRFLLRYSGFEPVLPIWANRSAEPHVVEDSELAKRFNALFYGFMDYAVIGLKA
jgi:SAM-dependent methyltransferase